MAALAGHVVIDAVWHGAVAVLSGHIAAGVLRNIWAYFIIACGHFTTEAHTFVEADLVHETKGQWYLRQILSAANFRGGVVLDVLSGNASHQIEHHIYPDLPSNRLAEIAPQVQEICERYGVPYNTGSLPRQVATVVMRIVRHSFPGGWDNLTRLRMPAD
jgi:fatty acid desaturase